MMENKIEATLQRPNENYIIDAPSVNINLPELIEQIINEKAWHETDRNAITIFKTNGLCMVLVALHKNAEMQDNKTNSVTSFQILKGNIAIIANEQNTDLKESEILVLHSEITYNIIAKEDSIILLTLTTTQKQFAD